MIIVKRKKEAVVREIIGIDGLKVAEYVDRGNDKLPYQILMEKHQNVV